MQTPTIEPPPASQVQADERPTVVAEPPWKPLYRVGGAAAVASVIVIPLAIIVFLTWQPPDFQPTSSAVIDWFKLFHDSPLRGLLDFDLLMLVGQALSVLIVHALFAALRRISPSFTAIALALSLIATTVYFSANQAFSMLTLSNQYATATTDAQRTSLVSAGQAMLALYQGSPFDVSYVLGGVATLIFAFVMLRSALFSKAIASVGIVMGILMLVPATAGTLGLVLSLISLIPTVIWDVLLARRFFQLARGVVQAETLQP